MASPIAPFATASFADPALASAYLNQVSCLAALKPEYLVLGPEVNFINVFNHAEWINFIPVYSQAYELAKTISPTTQVGLSFQYDGLRRDRLISGDDWSILTTGPRRDFIALTNHLPSRARVECRTTPDFPTGSRHLRLGALPGGGKKASRAPSTGTDHLMRQPSQRTSE